MLPRPAEVVGLAPHGEVALGCEDDLVARDLRQEAPEDLLGPAPGVDVRRVDKIAAAIEERLQDGERLLLVTSPLGGAEVQRAKRDARDQQPGRAEETVLHRDSLL